MDKKNLEILGLDETATTEDVKKAYETLRAKYLEERFMDGEAGNNAARMLTKIELAYGELSKEMSERAASDGGESGDAYEKIEQYLKDGNFQEAQRILDNFNERGAQWHYYQSVLFYRKNWINESKKQLEIAIQMEPDNQKYKETLRKLNEKINQNNAAANSANYQNGYQNGTYNGQTMNVPPQDDQMGGSFCARCLECYCYSLCINMLCSGCCR